MSPRSFRRAHQRRIAKAKRRQQLRARRAGFAAVAATGAFALSAPAAQADFEVNVLTDGAADACDSSCTLRDAVTLANSTAGPDTITFASSLSGTVRLTQGEIPIASSDSSATYVYGPGTGVIAVSGDADNSGTPNSGDSRIFNVMSGTGPVEISGLNLIDGYGSPGGALIVGGGTDVTLADAAVADSTSPTTGGGIASFGDATLTITDTTIAGNHATNNGGGISGGKYALNISDSTITGNTSDQSGGAISFNGKYGPLRISHSVISGNSAAQGGGLQFTAPGGPYADTAAHEIDGTTISGNDASGDGAGINFATLKSGDEFDLSHSTISGNTGGSGSAGGGISFNATVSGEFTATDSTISGNTADAGAGVGLGNGSAALLGAAGSIEFDNSTIASNTAAVTGGGLYLDQYSDGGGGYTSATIPLNSTIVADNSAAGSSQDLDRRDTSTGGGFDLSFSLVEAPGDAPLNQVPAGSSIVGVDPQLAALADNGGPTLTHLPAATSPVVDQGSAPPGLLTDQRDQPRTVDVSVVNASDGTDIGSVELAAGPPGPPSPPGPPPPGPPSPPGSDQTAPTTGVEKKPKKKIKTHRKRVKVKVAFSSDEPGSTFQCKVDNHAFKDCTSPFTTRVSSKPGKGKKHKILIQATDPAGNVEEQPAKVTFRVIRLPD